MKNSSNTRYSKDEAIEECMRNCPGPEKCPFGGYIIYASEDPRYSDLMYECSIYKEFRRVRENMERLIKVLPKGLWERRLDNFIPEDEVTERALDLSKKYVRHRAWKIGSNFVLLGGYGTGRTHLAAGIAIEAVNMGDTVAFITAPSLKIGDFKTVCEKVQECSGVDLLVIDDLSNETENKMTTDKIFELINHRYEQGAGTIITSNLNLTDFDGTVGARIFSRLGERTAIMRLEGVSSYREKKRERYLAWTREEPLEDQGPAER